MILLNGLITDFAEPILEGSDTTPWVYITIEHSQS
jgi:hypothetical protein